jgi:antitoxin VapB
LNVTFATCRHLRVFDGRDAYYIYLHIQFSAAHIFTHSLDKVYTWVYTNGEVIIMQTAKLFPSGKSQAVRLPKEFRFSDTESEVGIGKIGDMVFLFPKDKALDIFLASEGMSDDFFEIMEHRHDDEFQAGREPF